MSNKGLEESINSSDSVEGTEKITGSLEEKLGSSVENKPVNPSFIHEASMDGIIAPVDPMNRPVEDEAHFFETPDQEIPMGGTLASAGPMNGPVEDEVLFFETPDQEIPMGGTLASVGPMSNPVADGTASKGTPNQKIPNEELGAAV